MSKFNNKKVMPRYFAIAVVLALVGMAVVCKAAYIMTAESDYWRKVASRLTRDSVSVQPNRGNILSCDGQLMASSIPEYRIFLDFQPGDPTDTVWAHKLDSLWDEKIDSLCDGLSQIFPKSAAEFKEHLQKGREKVVYNKKLERDTKGARYWLIWKRPVDYNTFCEVKKLPLLNMPANKGGFSWEELPKRNRPFGSLAMRTVGDIGSETMRDENGRKVVRDTARFGLELAYDSLLRGTNGIVHHQKVLNKYMDITVAPPVDGADIVTTIDVSMQDLAERAVIDELELISGEMGVAILMEVATGDVKAMVNMERCSDGKYREMYNRAISFVCEPGSVFKVASILVALDDGVVDTSYVIHTGNGQQMMHGRNMKDHNWRRGGYQDINVARALEVSSNIGVSHVIDHFYGSNPKRYVEGLYRIGMHEDLQLPIRGYHAPNIRMPDKKTAERGRYWSSTTLPWMSIGYETQIAPINTVTFYNAIANNGRMMRPRFVQSLVKDGKVIKEFPPEVIKEQIARPEAVKTMQVILEHVVSQGLGKKAGSKLFKVAGKTGTAQIADEKGGYHSGIPRYWLSFAGFFPADNPRYTCIVCLKKSGLPASGGGMSGVVFHHIAEGVMAHNVKRHVEDARDTASVLVPEVKSGNVLAADYVLNQLNVKTEGGWGGTYAYGNPVWGQAVTHEKEVSITRRQEPDGRLVPDVTGMGARDAVYMLENAGIKVKLSGRGKVKSQSLMAGKLIQPHMICELHLE